jgi:hypothetical protein
VLIAGRYMLLGCMLHMYPICYNIGTWPGPGARAPGPGRPQPKSDSVRGARVHSTQVLAPVPPMCCPSTTPEERVTAVTWMCAWQLHASRLQQTHHTTRNTPHHLALSTVSSAPHKSHTLAGPANGSTQPQTKTKADTTSLLDGDTKSANERLRT